MNKNLFSKEIKRNRKALIIWSSIIVGVTLIVLASFPAMSDIGSDMAIMLMDKVPEGMKKMMNLDAQLWTSIVSFYKPYYDVYILIFTGIFTMSAGTTIISKEERDGTSEFLMSKPLSRKEIFTTKMMVLLTLMVIVLAVQITVAMISMSVFSQAEFSWKAFAAMNVHGASLVVFFTGLGVLISMYLNPKMNFMGLVVGLVFGSYFISAISKVTPATEWIGYISPFRYIDFNVSDPNYGIHFLNVAVLLILGIGCVVMALKVFQKKDLLT